MYMENDVMPNVVESRCHLVPPRKPAIYNPISAICHGYVGPSFDPMNMVANMTALEATRDARRASSMENHYNENIVSASISTHTRSVSEPKENTDQVSCVESSAASEKQDAELSANVVLQQANVSPKSRHGQKLICLSIALISLIGLSYFVTKFYLDLRAKGKVTDFPGFVQFSLTSSRFWMLVVILLQICFVTTRIPFNSTEADGQDEKLDSISV